MDDLFKDDKKNIIDKLIDANNKEKANSTVVDSNGPFGGGDRLNDDLENALKPSQSDKKKPAAGNRNNSSTPAKQPDKTKPSQGTFTPTKEKNPLSGVLDSDILRLLGFLDTQKVKDVIDSASELLPYYFIPIEDPPNPKDEAEKVVPTVSGADERSKDEEADTTPPPIVPQFQKFNRDGLLEIKFTPPKADVPTTWAALWDPSLTSRLTQAQQKRYREQIDRILQVVFIQNSDEASQSQFSSQLLEFTSAGIKIQISFGDPLLVSQGETPDRIKVRLLKSFFTRSQESEDSN